MQFWSQKFKISFAGPNSRYHQGQLLLETAGCAKYGRAIGQWLNEFCVIWGKIYLILHLIKMRVLEIPETLPKNMTWFKQIQVKFSQNSKRHIQLQNVLEAIFYGSLQGKNSTRYFNCTSFVLFLKQNILAQVGKG